MQRCLLVILLSLGALCMHSQQVEEVTLPVTDVASCVVRTGNTYQYQGQSMNKRAFRQFLLASDYMPAYERFQSGYRMAVAGWSVFGTGLAIGAVGVGFFGVGIAHVGMMDDTVAGAIGASAVMIACMYLGIVCLSAGGVLDLVSIPLLCVGYSRMHQSVDVYNVQYTVPQQSVSLGLHSSSNSIGLALCF